MSSSCSHRTSSLERSTPRRIRTIPSLALGFVLAVGIPAAETAAATAPTFPGPISVTTAGIVALADTGAAQDRTPTSAEPEFAPHMKSGRTAFLSSLLATGVLGGAAWVVKTSTGDQNHQAALGTAAALGITAYLVGPSVGHFYAVRARRAWMGIGVRTLIGLGFGATLVTLVDEGSDNDQGALSVACMVAGAGVVVFDIVDAPRSARIRNQRMRMSVGPASVGGAPGVRVNVGL